tara:strand:- start:32569 stop:32745 length:177 start_codon:yes stop_codon:yes gene_type:complete
MNLCDAVVTQIKGNPYQTWGMWLVDAEIDCYGHISSTVLAFKTEEEAQRAHIGMKVLV